MSRVVLDLRGTDEVHKLLRTLSGQQLQNRMRRALRRGGGVFRDGIRNAGPMGWARRPRSFYRTRTRNHRNPLGVSVAPQSPLSTIFEGGAGPHAIPIAQGPYAGRTVMHPGVAAKPFIGPIFASTNDDAGEAATDELFAGIPATVGPLG